jgi:DNA invertase Pin-like site-specific DNA recombinase
VADLPVVRCAIYTRKSSDEGLEQAYNSLAAQHDACAAYIQSQKHEGWIRVRTAYDDGGFSGGNLARPALQRLFADVERGEVDIIVVYKIDRLTRSLRDFAKIADLLEKSDASFVAVTQQFNSATSMGRLTLNVLLTFAQFEREVTGDRIRDKKAASTRLGMWMGGNPALGYHAPAKKLLINPKEAEDVRYIFRRFLELRSIAELRKDLVQRGIVSKQRTLKNGASYGGAHFTWHPLNAILTNPVYVGMIRHKKVLYPGQHAAIINPALFAEVQTVLAGIADSERARRILAYPSLLKGILFDMAGERLYPTHTRKTAKHHRYYVSAFLVKRKSRTEPKNRMRVTASALEGYVIKVLADRLRDRNWLTSILPHGRGLPAAHRSAIELATDLEHQTVRNSGAIRDLVGRVEMDRITIRLLLNRRWLLDRLGVRLPRNAPPLSEMPIEIKITGHRLKCGMQMKVVLENPNSPPEPDHRLVREILRAIRWFDAIASARYASILDLARAEGCCPTLVTDRIRLAFLAPDMVEMILEGRQPIGITIASLKRACPLPVSWEEQRSLLLDSQVALGN